jgi:hypothetical protein
MQKGFSGQIGQVTLLELKKGVFEMKVIRSIQKWLRKLWDSGEPVTTSIDSHKWENKIEILGHLSRRYF